MGHNHRCDSAFGKVSIDCMLLLGMSIALRNDHVGHCPDLCGTIDLVRWSGLCMSGDMVSDDTH